MPIKKTKKGWYWGSKGPFNSKKKAQQVAKQLTLQDIKKVLKKET